MPFSIEPQPGHPQTTCTQVEANMAQQKKKQKQNPEPSFLLSPGCRARILLLPSASTVRVKMIFKRWPLVPLTSLSPPSEWRVQGRMNPGWRLNTQCARGNFHFHSFQASFFLENHQKSWGMAGVYKKRWLKKMGNHMVGWPPRK